MKDISIYFKPIQSSLYENTGELFSSIQIYDESGFPEIDRKGVAIIYTPEFRNSEITSEIQNDSFRSHFYKLSNGDSWNFAIYDLGTITPGDNQSDTVFALSQVVSELVKNDIIPIPAIALPPINPVKNMINNQLIGIVIRKAYKILLTENVLLSELL